MFKGTNIGYKVLDRNIILYDKAVGAEEVQATMQAITVKVLWLMQRVNRLSVPVFW